MDGAIEDKTQDNTQKPTNTVACESINSELGPRGDCIGIDKDGNANSLATVELAKDSTSLGLLAVRSSF